MGTRDNETLEPGEQPYDSLNSVRIGALVGGIVGAVVLVLIPAATFWVVVIGAAFGGAVGYWARRRTSRSGG